MALPQTIQDVIDHLEQIVKDCEENEWREGYFAALYLRVTREVQRKIADNYFDDNPRMEQLDVIFANRYLEAYDRYRHHQSCLGSWQLAFTSCNQWRPIVLQHLLLGMNAHIGLDLGIAAATICPGNAIESLHADFNKINAILASLVNTVQDELSKIWRPLKIIDWLAGKLDEEMAIFSMDIARDAAWAVAKKYATITIPVQREVFIRTRDEKVASFGRKVSNPGWILSGAIGLIRVLERGTVKGKIEILSGKN